MRLVWQPLKTFMRFYRLDVTAHSFVHTIHSSERMCDKGVGHIPLWDIKTRYLSEISHHIPLLTSVRKFDMLENDPRASISDRCVWLVLRGLYNWKVNSHTYSARRCMEKNWKHWIWSKTPAHWWSWCFRKCYGSHRITVLYQLNYVLSNVLLGVYVLLIQMVLTFCE